MTSQLIDRLEHRIDKLAELLGPWDPSLEYQEDVSTAVDFLERSIESIYLDTFHINDGLFRMLDRYVQQNNEPLDEQDIKDIDYKMSLYNNDMKLMNEKLKQLDDIYVNKFLTHVDTFNDIPSRQFLDDNMVTKQYLKLQKLVTQQEELVVKTMATLRKVVDFTDRSIQN
ncbi:hypothetical protein MOSE0_I00210 [Monosporozyma servazzii]